MRPAMIANAAREVGLARHSFPVHAIHDQWSVSLQQTTVANTIKHVMMVIS